MFDMSLLLLNHVCTNKYFVRHEYKRCKPTTISILKFKSLTLEGLKSLVFSNVGSFYRDLHIQ